MKPTLQAGHRHKTNFEVTRDRTIGFMGEALRVYGTPSMVRDIEMACKDLLEST